MGHLGGISVALLNACIAALLAKPTPGVAGHSLGKSLTGEIPEEQVSRQAHGEAHSRCESIKERVELCIADPTPEALQWFSLRPDAAGWSWNECMFLREQKNPSLLQEKFSFEKWFDTSFEVEQQFSFDLSCFYFYFCFLKLFQLWFHFCFLSSCSCSSASQLHLSLHRNSFVSAWLVNLLGFVLF